MTFKKAILKLTALYVGIIVVLSAGFSLGLYNLALHEIKDNTYRQQLIIERGTRIMRLSAIEKQAYLDENAIAFDLARKRLLSQLILINLVIIGSGAIASYFVAKKTFQPVEAAYESQVRFAADASHELRTPITAMQAGIEATLMDPKLNSTKAKAQLESNLDELQAMQRLTEDLLRLARHEQSPKPPELITTDELAQAAIDRILPKAEKQNILIVDKTQSLPVKVIERAIVDVLVILLDNAIKYSPKNSQVTIASSLKNSMVSITVTDSGSGIPAKDLAHIFERFYRADSARSKQAGAGFGLGLAIAKQLIESQNGHLRARNVKGGAQFCILLPKAKL